MPPQCFAVASVSMSEEGLRGHGCGQNDLPQP
jgi:hypothetical protein